VILIQSDPLSQLVQAKLNAVNTTVIVDFKSAIDEWALIQFPTFHQ